MEADEDAVTPSTDACRVVFERAFRRWSCHSNRVSRATTQAALDGLGVIHDAFPVHPAFPRNLRLTKSSTSWLATGFSTWDAAVGFTSSGLGCVTGMPAIAPQKRSFPVTKTNPTRLRLKKDLKIGPSSWLGHNDGHITLLVLAWAYILSARWTEIIPGAGAIRYTDAPAEPTEVDHSTAGAPIDSMSKEAARWWLAVLAPGQGWTATANSNGTTLSSPWSIELHLKTTPVPSFLRHFPSRAAAPDSTTALRYLSEYSTIHGLADQSRAALSAALLLPLATVLCSRINLPAPHTIPFPAKAEQGRKEQSYSLAQVDKLMALSCNTRGLQAILLSSFFDPEVPCNLVSPFLQGTFAAVDNVIHDQSLLAHSLMRQSHKAGFLWVGAMILGAHAPLLEKARYGSIDIDLVSAIWTGTTQTFMQQPVSATQPGRIRREDECRLAYLASEDYQHNIPLCPWKPFGTIALKDAELDVQIHAACGGHGLRYQGWAWDCWEDECPTSAEHQPPAIAAPDTATARPQEPGTRPAVEIPFDKLDLEDDIASSAATLNIFMWLRRGGFAASEQHIRQHEWLCEVLDDEEEEAYESWPEDGDESTGAAKKRAKSSVPRPRLGRWLASTHAGREGSL